MVDKEHPVCTHCRQVLDEYMETRAAEYMETVLKEKLDDYVLPDDKIKDAIADHIGEFLDAKILHWESEFKLKMDELYDQTIDALRADLKTSACHRDSPDMLGLEDVITETVQRVFKEGLASLKPASLSRGKKKAKTSEEAA
jgi:hypothetical protein